MSTAAVQLECPSIPRCDEAALIEIVACAMHPSAAEWLFLRELRVGTGHQNGGAQRLDAFALNTLPHMAMKRVCYEVKTSRADFLSELKRPLKRRIGMRYSNEFYFVTPADLVQGHRDSARMRARRGGLSDVRRMKGTDRASRRFLQLRSRDAGLLHDYSPRTMARYSGPTWQLVAAMLRNQRRQFTEQPLPLTLQERLELR
jgi:hypothetical protein